uniref:Reverse transcriptase domain-containing protein n=1 Tax=Strongyloides venezuelensis TaxID=75913 RepID=A0A0K0G2D8_STRVS
MGVLEETDAQIIFNATIVRKKEYVSFGIKVLSQRLSQLQGVTKFSDFDLRQFYLQVKMQMLILINFMFNVLLVTRTLKLDCEMEKITPERKFGLFSYKDDIVFFTKKELEFLHLKVIEIIFQVFKQVNLKINVAKMSLNVDKIQFLNFMASVKGLDPCLEYVKTVQEVHARVKKGH